MTGSNFKFLFHLPTPVFYSLISHFRLIFDVNDQSTPFITFQSPGTLETISVYRSKTDKRSSIILKDFGKQSDLKAVLESMGQEYGVTFTPEQEKKFMLASTFGVPMKNMKTYLDLPTDKQDAVLKNEGIPCDSLDNQFKSWVRNARAVNADLRIAIKADADTPYSVIKNVMNSLQDLRENRYNLITSLKTTSEN